MVICIYSEIAHYKVIKAVFPWEFTVIFSVRFMLLALVISFRENEKWTLYLPVNKKVIHLNSATVNS